MIHVAETLAIHSIEGFLSRAEIDVLRAIMDSVVTREGVHRYDTDRTTTMHAIPGHTSAEAMAVYEPTGRVEITDLPEPATAILADATSRSMPAIQRAMPSITAYRPWTYVEYGPGQHITPHVDGIAPDPHTWPRQIAGISIVIDPADSGGGFSVETTGCDTLWTQHQPHDHSYAPSMSIAHDGADCSSTWFRDIDRTQWTVNPAPGTALLYGSQLTHGTQPVVRGRARKFISWLIAESPSTPDKSDRAFNARAATPR